MTSGRLVHSGGREGGAGRGRREERKQEAQTEMEGNITQVEVKTD